MMEDGDTGGEGGWWGVGKWRGGVVRWGGGGGGRADLLLNLLYDHRNDLR